MDVTTDSAIGMKIAILHHHVGRIFCVSKQIEASKQGIFSKRFLYEIDISVFP